MRAPAAVRTEVRSTRLAVGRNRVRLAIGAFALVYLVIAGRLVQLGVAPGEQERARYDAEASLATRRPDIFDRNGRLIATDIPSSSLYAEPKKMLDPDEAADQLAGVFHDLDPDDLRKKFSTGKGFVWIKREISPREQAQVLDLGIPGVGFLSERRRIYPNGAEVAHIIGAVDPDSVGLSGIEKYIDTSGMVGGSGIGSLLPVDLSLDLAVQHAVRDELIAAMKKYHPIAASGAVMDVETGEMLALVSMPDFDPNVPADALKPENINRVNVGVYEMGSTFKALTIAMALDSGRVKLSDTFDTRQPLQYGRFRIDDFHPTRRVLTVPEVFIHSSNIGTAKMALLMGVDAHKAFLKKTGQLDRLRTELPESAAPIVPRRWGELNTVTIAFGHGLSVAPLQTLMATAAMVNGGILIPPTFLKRSKAEAEALGKRVIKPETSGMMRYLMRLNAESPEGSAKKADVPGYRVGGKTGTAEKVINGRYAKGKNFNAFTAVFPADAPRYLLLVTLDEPQPAPDTHGFATAGWNAAPTTGAIIRRIAPLLGIEPRFDLPSASPELYASIRRRD